MLTVGRFTGTMMMRKRWLATAALVAATMAATPAIAQVRDADAGAYLAARNADARGDVSAAARYFPRALAEDPDNLALMEATALALIAAGRVTDAMAIAERLDMTLPDNRMASLALTVRSIRQSDFKAARARLAASPDAFQPLLRQLLNGWAAYGAGDVEAAAAAFAALNDRPVLELFGQFHLGLMWMIEGDAAAALAAFEIAEGVVTTPTTRLSMGHGGALEALGRADEARALYERTLAASRFGDPVMEAALRRLADGGAPTALAHGAIDGAAEALFGLAGALLGESGARTALIHARLATYLRPELTPAQLMAAELLDSDEQSALALAAFAAVAGDDPLWARAQIRRAAALERMDRSEAAAEALRALTAREPANAEGWIALADLLRRREEFEPAIDAYRRAIDIVEAAGRADWTLHYQRAISYERSKQWPAAEADFLRALELSPDQPLVLNYLGYSWVEMRHNLDEAKAMIRRAVDLRPQDGYITDSLGWVYYRLGDFDAAVEWLEKAVALTPVDPVINDHLGDALWQVGRRLEAVFQWKRARSLDPAPEDLERIRRKLAAGLDAVLAEEGAAGTPPAASAAGGDGG